jgi:hypothetical protein
MINKFSIKFIDFDLPKIDGVYSLGEKEPNEQNEMLSGEEEDLILSIFSGFKVIMGKTRVHIEFYSNIVSKEEITIKVSKLKDEWFRVTYYECALNREKLSSMDAFEYKWIENVYHLKCDQYYGLKNALLFLKERCQYVKSYILGH